MSMIREQAVLQETVADGIFSLRLANDVVLEFEVKDGLLQGLIGCTVDGLALMSPDSVRLPLTETRDGWAIAGYRLLELLQDERESVIRAHVLGVKSGVSRKLDALQVPYLTIPQRRPSMIGLFEWRFTPETVVIGDPAVRANRYNGFSYSFSYRLDAPFHWIVDGGTWEVGGRPQGVTLFSPHLAPIGGPMEYTIPEQGGRYTSAETFVKGSSNNADVIPDIPNDPALGYVIPVQAQLRGAGGNLIDFQHNGEAVFLSFYRQPDYYKSLIEWNDGAVGIGHLDQHFFPLSHSYETPAKTVLAARVEHLTRSEALNRWTDAWEATAQEWRRVAGLPRTDPVPGFGIDACGAAGVDYGSGPTDLFDRWEARLDWMKEFGVKLFFISSFLKHRGMDLPGVANMCQPYDYTVHPAFGGEERFRLFCERAHERGIKVFTWLGVFLSSYAPILKEHPEWKMVYDNGAVWDSSYQILQALSLERGFADWLLNDLNRLKSLGLDGVFIDSYHNLSALPIDYGDPRLTPQFRELMRFQARCEAAGIETIIESIGPLGITSCGLWPQYLKPIELSYWTHYRAIVDPGPIHDFHNGHLSESVYFTMIANKAPLGFSVREQADAPFEGLPDLPAYVAGMNALYTRFSPDMQVRTLHEDGTVEWRDPATGRGVLFGTRGRVTVPSGHVAIGQYGTEATLQAGTHETAKLTAFILERA